MAENACEDDLKFSLLVEGIVIKAETETTNEKSEIIRDVIRFHINTWLDQVEQFDAAYKVSELIPVGSYAEGTKIMQADEFDYLAVIPELSKPDVIKIDVNESDINQGLVKVVVADETLKLKWSGLCKDGHLKCFQPINFPGMGENRFGHVVIGTLWKFVRNSRRKRHAVGSPTNIDCKILLPTRNGVSLYFTGAVFRAPNVILNFEYENRDVSVDVSPAIRYHKIHDCFKVEDCAGPQFAELVLQRKSLLLVGTERESDFKVTVTEAEVEYILTVMKPEHKIIYVFLKYIVKLYETVLLDTFTSYMMKTVCFHHDINCRQNNRSIMDCFKSVVKDLNLCTAQQFIVSIVNKHINLKYQTDLYLETKLNEDRQCLLQGMTAMCQVPAEIETIEDFDRFMKQIVDKEGQKRLKAAREREEMNREHHERIKAELEERVSNIVAMGFDPDEVKGAMKNALNESELAIRILKQQNAKEREKEMIKEICSTSGGFPIQVSETHSINEACSNDGVSGTLPVSANSSQGRSSGSEEFLLAVHDTQNTTVTHEILYQRKKAETKWSETCCNIV